MASNNNSNSSRLKSLELQGYKTFASKNVFEFAPTITAIVGPNGSGKSNIADAIRWVLGEQSYSLLRGKKTEDMIFSGSETRSRAGMASATIVFDNEEGWLPIDFTEVTVGRRAYRDSVNEYYLNNQKVRLRDVSELLAECGLAHRTYTIIGQGLVDAALSLNPEERRRLFEEAAGISLFRNRKQEALRRLTSTRRNLERVQDILAELRPRLRSLERQAKRATDYGQVKDDLNSVLRIWYGYHWYHLQDLVTEAITSADERKTARDKLRDLQQKAERELLALRSRISSLRGQVQTWNQEVADLHRQREGVERTLAVATERTRWLKDQVSVLEAEISSTGKRRENLMRRLESEKGDVGDRQKELAEAQNSIRLLRPDSGESESPLRDDVPNDVEGIRKDLAVVIAEDARNSTQIEQLNDRNRVLSETLESNAVKLKALQEELNQLSENEARITDLLERARQENLELDSQKSDSEQKLINAKQQKEKISAELIQLQLRRAALDARLELSQVVQRGINETVDIIRKDMKSGDVDGFLGVLDDRVRIRSMYQPAIFAALGEYRSALAFTSLEAIDQAITRIRAGHQFGRVAFLPLSGARVPEDLDTSIFPGVLGSAVEFVEAQEDFQPILRLVLGRTLVVRNLDEARDLSGKLPIDARMVTLDGTVVYPTGQVIMGSGAEELLEGSSINQLEQGLTETNSKIEGFEVQRQQLDEELEELEKHISSFRRTMGELEQKTLDARNKRDKFHLELSHKQGESETLLSEINDFRQEKIEIEEQLASLIKRTSEFESKRAELEDAIHASALLGAGDQSELVIAQAQARYEVSQRVYDGAESRLGELTEQLEDLDSDLEFKKSRHDSIQTDHSNTLEEIAQANVSLSEIEEQIEDARKKIEPEETVLRESEELRTELETDEMRTRAELQDAEREHSRAQILLARRQEELVSLQRRIEDDFGLVAFDFENGVMGQDPLPFEGLVEHLPRVEDVPEETENQVNRLRNQLRRLGAVNPSAKVEYDEVRNRVDFLTTQLEDSHKAEEQIQNVIAELDLLMEREFRKTFDAVAIEFQEAFTHLFGGGSARLSLTDSDDLTQTGIDIEARLPGRREQGLAMLSGGERSLTACSLIFALMKVSPTPFCVLDEVDAMLDDINVVRFREMLQDLSKTTQFVVITHNRMTVQVAEVVYGVTMGSDSASQIISLRLEDAEKVLAGKG